MELKQYQEDTLAILRRFLEDARGVGPKDAYEEIVRKPEQAARLGRYAGAYVPLEALPDAPYVCLRLPTGGGKTILAAHAVAVARDAWIESAAPRRAPMPSSKSPVALSTHPDAECDGPGHRDFVCPCFGFGGGLVDSAPRITPLILQIATFDADRVQDGSLLRVIRHQIPNHENHYRSAGNFGNPLEIFGKQIQEGGDVSGRRNQQREPKSPVIAPVPVGESNVVSLQPCGIREALPYLVPGLLADVHGVASCVMGDRMLRAVSQGCADWISHLRSPRSLRRRKIGGNIHPLSGRIRPKNGI